MVFNRLKLKIVWMMMNGISVGLKIVISLFYNIIDISYVLSMLLCRYVMGF